MSPIANVKRSCGNSRHATGFARHSLPRKELNHVEGSLRTSDVDMEPCHHHSPDKSLHLLTRSLSRPAFGNLSDSILCTSSSKASSVGTACIPRGIAAAAPVLNPNRTLRERSIPYTYEHYFTRSIPRVPEAATINSPQETSIPNFNCVSETSRRPPHALHISRKAASAAQQLRPAAAEGALHHHLPAKLSRTCSKHYFPILCGPRRSSAADPSCGSFASCAGAAPDAHAVMSPPLRSAPNLSS